MHSEAASADKAGAQETGSVKRIIRRGDNAGVPLRGDRLRDRARLWVWTIATLAILLIGGANNTYPLPRGLAEMIAAILLGGTIASSGSHFGKLQRSDWLVFAIIALPLIQFIPLPPALWTMLPGRELVAQMDRSVFGELPWRPITLDIEQSLASLFFLIPAAAYYVAVRTGDRARTKAILLGVVVALAIGAVMAALQIAGQAWAYPFADGRADNTFAIGFFTNHNHQATFLLMGLMVMAGWIALDGSRNRSKARRAKTHDSSSWENLGTREMVLGALAILAALLVLLTGSRAGLLLMAIGLPAAVCAWLAPHLAGSRKLLWPALGVVALGACVFLALPFLGDGQLAVTGDRSALADDRRFDIWPQAAATAWQMMPTGSGFGTFRGAYEMFEPLDMVGMLYVNHAHNDYLQLAIEGGAPAILLIAAFLLAWLHNSWRAWTQIEGREALLARLASIILLVLLLHSLVDYPARTITIISIAAIAFGILVRHSAQIPTRLAWNGGSV